MLPTLTVEAQATPNALSKLDSIGRGAKPYTPGGGVVTKEAMIIVPAGRNEWISVIDGESTVVFVGPI